MYLADASSTRSSVTIVTIHITDENDNTPTFAQSQYKVKVREDLPVGSVIAHLVAHDPDLPESSGQVSYRIIKGINTSTALSHPVHCRVCETLAYVFGFYLLLQAGRSLVYQKVLMAH